jgi:5'-3' exoribonuclease 1
LAMGVPKFYRWLSERYPLINQLISDGRMLPEFDNLYLDMNGIIHACTHPSDDMLSATMTQREMILGIFRYIERTVNVIVKPKKLLFIAVDGVAPRAKLNQQRSRRFRAAEERVAGIEKARAKGETIDETKIFDSNCITPGTEFMEMVGKHIRWFIRKKVKEDPLWRDMEVIFSGHDVPGEGEHKIMQYIRDQRALPNYQPNMRHCMLGQDADLIMLGLVSHEPHFTLLREVIEFGGRKFMSTRQTVVKQTRDAKFQLLHVSILREYIEVEFFGASTQTFALDRERLIDDFVFLTFLVGNDFLPHLPTLDISENAFDVIFDAYKGVLKADPGYLVENGEIKSFARLETLFAIIGKQEQEILEKRDHEAVKFAKRNQRGRGRRDGAPEGDAAVAALEREIRALQLAGEDADDLPPLNATGGAATASSTEFETESDLSSPEPDSAGAAVPMKPFARKDYRAKYYAEKFHVPIEDLVGAGAAKHIPVLEDLKQTYIAGLIWCLAYYCKGCISWTWYFPYHYGPMLQDMDRLEEVAARIQFDLSEPFFPFQQLLGCLPPASANLLPAAYQWLMLGEHSPMKASYPDTFEIDMNGKKSPWEAVVLLPFIDEKMLLQSELKHCSVAAATAMGRPLHRSDLRRNEFGRIMSVRYSPGALETVPFPAGYADLGFADILSCQTESVDSMYDTKPGASFRPEIIPGTITPYPGFPSLGILPIAGTRTEAVKLNIFGSPSRYRSSIVILQSSKNPFDPGTIDLSLLLGKTVYVNYPLSFEARVVSVETEMKHYRCPKDLVRYGQPISPDAISVISKGSGEASRWNGHAESIQAGYLAGLGIPGTGGLDIGRVTLTLGVLPLQGMERDFATGARTKVFGNEEAVVPIQLALWSCPVSSDPRFEETGAMPLKELFPYDVSVLVVGGHYSGYMGRVVGPHGPKGSKDTAAAATVSKDRKSLKSESKAMSATERKNSCYSVDIEFADTGKEPDFGLSIAGAIQDRYFSSRDVCRMTQLSPSVLGQIVGCVLLEGSDGKEIDIGLNLRRNGQYQLLGYCRRIRDDGEEAANAVIAQRAWHERADTMSIIGSSPDELDSAGESVIPQKAAPAAKGGRGGHKGKAIAAAPVAHSAPEEKMYWEYSARCVDLIKSYKQQFGIFFSTLENIGHQRKHSISGLLGAKGQEVLDEIVSWMKAQPFFAMARTPLATIALCTDAIAAIETAAAERMAAAASAAAAAPVVAHGMPSDVLFRGDIYAPTDVPPVFENPQYPQLGYRVVNVTSQLVPFGYRGTVVAIHGSSGFVEVGGHVGAGQGRDS